MIMVKYDGSDDGGEATDDDNNSDLWEPPRERADLDYNIDELKTLANVSACVCGECMKQIKKWTVSDPNTVPRRSLFFADWGRIPTQLPELNLLEELALSKYITANRIQKYRAVNVNKKIVHGSAHVKLCGHSIALPLENGKIVKSESKLPRTRLIQK